MAQVVLRDGFRISRNAYDWLGDGVYFFQDAPNRAREWAAQRYGSDGVVIRSVIRLDDCLDLLDIQWNDLLVRAYHLFVEISERAGRGASSADVWRASAGPCSRELRREPCWPSSR